jgi:hypothetical protein
MTAPQRPYWEKPVAVAAVVGAVFAVLAFLALFIRPPKFDPLGWKRTTETVHLITGDDDSDGSLRVPHRTPRACTGPKEPPGVGPGVVNRVQVGTGDNVIRASSHFAQCRLTSDRPTRRYSFDWRLPDGGRIDQFGGTFGIDYDPDQKSRPEETVEFIVRYGTATLCDLTVKGHEKGKTCPEVSREEQARIRAEQKGPQDKTFRPVITQVAGSDADPPFFATVIDPTVKWSENSRLWRLAVAASGAALVALVLWLLIKVVRRAV